jgi:hypothetical protein
MLNKYNRFLHSLAWNTAESVIYHAILLNYQLWLFSKTKPALYGNFGVIFSGMYLITTITNLGLDSSLAPFLSEWSKSKSQFKSIIKYNVIPNYLFLGALICTLFFVQDVLGGTHAIFSYHKKHLFFICAAITITESIKKTSKHLLQILFNVRQTALTEISTIILYAGTIWYFYTIGYPINAYLIFIPMLTISALTATFLLYVMYGWYCMLPNNNIQTYNKNLQKRITKARCYTYLTELSNTLFSTNFLVPLFAQIYGLEIAGILKLTGTITHSLTVMIHKIFSSSSNALLAHIKHKTLDIKRKSFSIISNILYHILYSICIFFTINSHLFLASTHSSHPYIAFWVAMLYFMISFVENFAIVYEKFFINEEKAHYLFFTNITTIIAFLIIATNAHQLSIITTLILMAFTRILFVTILSIISYKIWRLTPQQKIYPNYLALSIITSAIFFIMSR